MTTAGDLVQVQPLRRQDPARGPQREPGAGVPPVQFDIDAYLGSERAKDLLRFSTAGSVDDGKSTLIGRLLYDTQSVYEDQVRAIEGKGTTAPGVLDLALLTDGLRAEREQGITIDVAYRYFSTAKRKFIIADTPGHEEYTRNMATGASTADVAIVLIDARKGVLVQSRRHAYITALLGVGNVIVAVNKMDLVDYSEEVFDRIAREFSAFFAGMGVAGAAATRLHFIPVSALLGDNVVHRSETMAWYAGPSLLTLLEDLPSAETLRDAPFRMAVQRVVRPSLDFRGFAGQIAAGVIRPGDRVAVLPSGQTSCVARIVTYDGDLSEAVAPLSVTLTLEDEIDISRGDLMVAEADAAEVVRSFEAAVVWMDATALKINRRYLMKIGSVTVPAHVRSLRSTVDLAALEDTPTGSSAVQTLGMNALGRVWIETVRPVALDAYTANRRTGSFILIDPHSNATVAAGMVQGVAEDTRAGEVQPHGEAVSAAEREARYGHRGTHLALRAPVEIADAIERALFERGALVLRVAHGAELPAQALIDLGVLVLTVTATRGTRSLLEVAESGRSISLEAEEQTLKAGVGGLEAYRGVKQAVRAAINFLQKENVLHSGGKL